MITRGPSDEFISLNSVNHPIDPSQPSAQRGPIRIHQRKERRGVRRLEQPKFQFRVYAMGLHEQCALVLATMPRS